MRRIGMWWLVALLGCGLVGAQAQEQDQAPPPPAQDANQAPANSDSIVARLSLITGSVSTARGDSGEWTTGAVNAPLVSGDKVAAGAGSRAEVQLDYADVLRLGDNAQANLVNLSRTQIQIQVASGLAEYVVLKGGQANSEIDTPNIAIRPQGEAVIRILVPSDGETQVIMRKGDADISTPQGSTTLHQGQLITVEGTDTPQYKISDAPAQDAWDHWNNDRNKTFQDAAALQYTNSYYTGVQDLDGNGYWTSVPGYGQVWVPYGQGPSWAPYSNGRWSWQPYWGWTWVDAAPWGWAPYHYGRWFFYGSSWAWWPGPVTPYYRPLWAPAYVSFFGWGGGFGINVGFGFGSIGWLPLGPCDGFRPWWGGRGYYGYGFHARNGLVAPLAVGGRGRVVYSNLDAMRSNSRVRAAMVRVPSADFGRGSLAARQHVSAADLQRGQMVRGSVPVAPQRGALALGRPVSRPLGSHVAATHFFGHAAAAPRASFAQEQSRVENNLRAGNSGTRAAAPAARTGTAPGSFARGNDNAAPANRSGGWARFGTAAAANPSQAQGAATRPGFQRFSGPPSGGNRADAASGRSFNNAAPRPEATRPGFQRFTPAAAGSQPYRGTSGNEAPRGIPGYRGGESRPPLEVGHSIVQAPRPSYNRGSAPRGGGSAEARPSGGGGDRPSGGYGGGRPSGGGGGHPSGGGHPGGGGHPHR